MLQSLMPLLVALSWLALPVALVCIVDDWFLRPRRAIAAAAPPRDHCATWVWRACSPTPSTACSFATQ